MVELAHSRIHLASRLNLLVNLVLHQPKLSEPQLFLASRPRPKVHRAYSVKTNKLRTLFSANSPHSSSSHLKPLISSDQGHSRSRLQWYSDNFSNSPSKRRYSAEPVNSSSNRAPYSGPNPRRLR